MPDVPEDCELLGIPFYKGPDPAGATLPGDLDISWLVARGFEGKAGETQVFKFDDTTALAIGLGEANEVTLDSLRRAGAALSKAASKSRVAAFVLGATGSPFDAAAASQAVAEGALLGAYEFMEYKSAAKTPATERVVVVGGDAGGVQRGATVASAVAMARDLVNSPPSVMTPRRIAEVAGEVAQQNGLDITVLDEHAIEAERLGGLRGVSLGSDEPPRFIEMTYEPEGFESTIALVGKGITFDSGGLSLKPADGMMTMKTDMSGAAAVIGVMSTLPALAPKVKVIGLICATENLPGPKAIKPGDVLRARNGKTMEVLNTDAEGRLVLADGLSLAVEAGVDAIVDVATLTGACVVALGPDIAGLMTNNDGLRGQVQAAAERSGESLWHLPLPKQYRKHIDSEIADIKNIGASKGAGGAITAGLFLQEFVADTPWVHLDIAGPARADSDDGYVKKGGSGFGVRTLIDLVGTFQKP